MKWTKDNVGKGYLFAVSSNLDYGICCAYKIHFEGGYFYIGHTECLKRRINTHISHIKNEKYPYGYRKRAFGKKLLVVEILEVCTNSLDANELEINEINKVWGDRHLLNCVRAGANQYRMERHYMADLRKQKPELAKAIERKFPAAPQYDRTNPVTFTKIKMVDGSTAWQVKFNIVD